MENNSGINNENNGQSGNLNRTRRSAGQRPRQVAGQRPVSTEGQVRRRSAGTRPASTEGQVRRSAGTRPVQGEGQTRRSAGQRPVSAEGQVRRSAGQRPTSTEGQVRRSAGQRSASTEGQVRRRNAGTRPVQGEGQTRRSAGQRPVQGEGQTRKSMANSTGATRTRAPRTEDLGEIKVKGSTAKKYPSISSNAGGRRNSSFEGSRSSSASAGRRYKSSYSDRSTASRRTSDRRGKKYQVGQFKPFWKAYGIFVAVLLVLSFIFLRYTDNCLKKYEESQPGNAMEIVMYQLDKMVEDGSIIEKISLPVACEYEDSNSFTETFLQQLKDANELTYEKDSNSYNSEEPIYDVMADGTLVGKITLSPYDQHTVFGMLTIMDWKVKSFEPEQTGDTLEYTVTVPENFNIKINGKDLGADKITNNNVDNADFQNLKEYVELPKLVEYKVGGFSEQPEIKVTDSDGNEQICTPDSENKVLVVASCPGEIPEDRKLTALTISQMWEDFVTRDLKGDSYGLSQIQANLINGSYYWNLAREYAAGPDITMISDHTLADPAFSDIVVDNYVVYSDQSYSCHISFKKNMLLTKRNNKPKTEEVDSTFYFIYIDDSSATVGADDGVDNPHWCMVDMVATTK